MSLTSKQITASLLLEDGTLLSCTGTTPSTVVSTTTQVCLSPTINNATLRIYAPSSGGTFTFQIMISPSASVDVVAAKLELGTRSTLARLVNGQWVLNDPPPNFQQELAKCKWFAKKTQISQNICVADSDNQIQILLLDPTPMRIKTPTGEILSKIYAHQTDSNSVVYLSNSAFTINENGGCITIKDSRLTTGKMYVVNESDVWNNFVSTPTELFVSADL